MKTIKHLSVKVTYKVGLGNVEVSDQVFDQLNQIAEDCDEIDIMGNEYPEASEWIRDNIREADCYDFQYEIDDLS